MAGVEIGSGVVGDSLDDDEVTSQEAEPQDAPKDIQGSVKLSQELAYSADVETLTSADVRRAAQERGLRPEIVFSILLGELVERRKAPVARKLLEDALENGVPVGRAGPMKLIRGLVLGHDPELAFDLLALCSRAELFFDVGEMVKLTRIVASNGREDLLDRCLTYLESRGVSDNPALKAAQLRCYAINGEVAKAIAVFETLESPSAEHLEPVVRLLAQAGQVERARALLPPQTAGRAYENMLGEVLSAMAPLDPVEAARLAEQSLRDGIRTPGLAVTEISRALGRFLGASAAIQFITDVQDVGYKVIDRTVRELVRACSDDKDTAAVGELLDIVMTRKWPFTTDHAKHFTYLLAALADGQNESRLVRLCAERRVRLPPTYWRTHLETAAAGGDASDARSTIASMFASGVNPSAENFTLVARSYTGTLEHVGRLFDDRCRQWLPGPPSEIAGVLILSVLECYAATKQTENIAFVVAKFEGWEVTFNRANLGPLLMAAAKSGTSHVVTLLEQLVEMESTTQVDGQRALVPQLPRPGADSMTPVLAMLARLDRPAVVERCGTLLEQVGLDIDTAPFRYLAEVYRGFWAEMRRHHGGRSDVLAAIAAATGNPLIDDELTFLKTQATGNGDRPWDRYIKGFGAALPPTPVVKVFLSSRFVVEQQNQRWTRVLSLYGDSPPAELREARVVQLARTRQQELVREMVLDALPSGALTVGESAEYLKLAGVHAGVLKSVLPTLYAKHGVVRPERLLQAVVTALTAKKLYEEAREEVQLFRDRGCDVPPAVWSTYFGSFEDPEQMLAEYESLQQEGVDIAIENHQRVLSILLREGRSDLANDIVETLRRRVAPQVWSQLASPLLIAAARLGDLERAERIRDQIESSGIMTDAVARRALTQALVAAGVLDERALMSDRASEEVRGPIAEFMGDIAHELLNVIETMNTYVLLAEMSLDDEPHETAALLKDLDRTIVALRAKVDRWEALANPPPTAADGGNANVRWVIDTLAAELEGEFAAKNVSFETKVVPPLNEKRLLVGLDPRQLDSVVRNLVNNSLRQLDEVAAPRIRVTALHVASLEGRLDPPNGWVQITVRDNGPGIDEGIRLAIFESGVTSRVREKGLGRGLALVKRIIEDGGGDIHLTTATELNNPERAADTGSFAEFTMLIPAGRPSTHDASEEKE